MAKPINANDPWFVVRTNIKCEAKASENLRLAGFQAYYPRQRTEVKHKRTKTVVVKERPLMQRYLFVAIPSFAFGFVRACEGVESILGINGRPIRVPGAEVQALYLAEVDMLFDDTREARIRRKEEAETRKKTMEMRFAPGTSVNILEGPFATFGAVVHEVTRTGNISALVSLFGRLTTVEFEAAQLEVA